MGGFSTLPVGGAPNKMRNPILDEIDRAASNAHATLSPQAQEVVRRTTAAPVPGPGNTMDRSPVEQPPMPAQPIAGPSGSPRPIALPPPRDTIPQRPMDEMHSTIQRASERAMGMPSPASPMPVPAGADQWQRGMSQEAPGSPQPAQPIATPAQARLAAEQAPPIHHHNKFLRGLGYAGDALLTTFAPRAAQVIPGTMLNKQLKLANAENAVTDEQSVLNDQSKRGLEQSQARHAEAQAAGLENPQNKPPSNTVELFNQDPEKLAQYQSIVGKTPQQREPHITTTKDGTVLSISFDEGGTPTSQVVYQGEPNSKYTPQDLPAPDGKMHRFLMQEGNPEPVHDFGAIPDKPPGAEQSTTDIRNYEYYVSQGGKKTFDQYQTDDANRKRQQIAITTGGLTNPQSARVMQIANQFDGEPNVKRFNTIQEAQSLVSKLGTGAGANSTDDQALVYAFAKAMDPDSVVREGEYNTVQKYAQSWAESLGFNAQRIFSNTPFLTDQARRQMKDTITKKFAASQANYDRTFNEYGRRIEVQAGVPKGTQYLIDYRLNGQQPSAGTGGGGIPTVGQQYNGGTVRKVTKIE